VVNQNQPNHTTESLEGWQIPPWNDFQIKAALDWKELAKYATWVPPYGLCLVNVNYNQVLLNHFLAKKSKIKI
ncbi:hypothetical protein, partial [Proteus mirabilis]|uniref:hypothetical protein n=1 Tax=Proteus mirabilis TaxID=584 RepID=UPI001C12F7AA